ncbi:MAG: lysophospholipase [Dictyoglomus sp.]|nr:lysophospholipase [Dictyoglomus sp.]MCX7941542.1 lysophospholipase [Dictyoglomaceae bacterium]MDW8187838.1 alpha/beta hydrolase [Dictyoglomus sp.]
MIYSFKKGKPERGWILLVHGLGEHIGRYEEFINTLLNKNFGVIGFDLPGHGKSGGKRGDTSIEEVIEIINNLTENIENFIIFGHSLGGLIAIRYAQEYPEKIKAIIVSAPALYLKTDYITKVFAHIFVKIFPSLTIDNRLNLNYLSKNKIAIEKYRNDPLVHRKISLRLGISMIKNIDIAQKKAELISVPILFLIPSEDKIVPPIGSKELFNNIKISDKYYIEFPGGYHELFEDEEHSKKFYEEIYNFLISRSI